MFPRPAAPITGQVPVIVSGEITDRCPLTGPVRLVAAPRPGTGAYWHPGPDEPIYMDMVRDHRYRQSLSFGLDLRET